ncbi:MAG: DUF342 domain-containing protein [Clostridia bacterium]|nr:DUF342 domain-containing protein [Clostridia bacterium]
MLMYESDMFELLEGEEGAVYIKLKERGVALTSVNEVLKNFPRIRISSFTELQRVLKSETLEKGKIGDLRERVEIEISADEMTAALRLNLTTSEIKENIQGIRNEVVAKLNQLGVCVGIKTEILDGEFLSCRKQIIAEGMPPVAGRDAKCRYFKLSEIRPELKDDGKADLYEMNLIDNIVGGEWLGEKTMPEPGITGQTVLGRELPAKSGRDYRLRYDTKSVMEKKEGDLFVLRAKKEGAVKFENGKIMVHNHLMIQGDVDYETGNIHFDGDVTVKGTVKDKFIVEATGDIAIESPNGIGAVGKIVSKKGSIYVKGGINGRGEAVIIAKDSIYVKYVNEGHLVAHNTVNIGLYAIDSYIKADKVVMDPRKGRLIGGEVHAEHKIITGSIGNQQERQTRILVKGFERRDIKGKLESLSDEFKAVIDSTNRLKRQLEIFENNMEKLDERAVNSYKEMISQYEDNIDEINRLNNEVNQLEDTLKTRGDGEIKVHKAVYPKTYLEIKSLQKRVSELTACSFYVQNRVMHSI